MGVYIKGMEIPEHCGYCRFRYDGICHALQKTQYHREDCPLVPVPPHGRLGDLEALAEDVEIFADENAIGKIEKEELLEIVKYFPTIIPAEEGE